jgi:ribonuclease P protein component
MPHNRFGFVTSKRLGRAVVRNRVRRRLQEAVRLMPLRQGWDIVFSAKTAAAQAGYHDLRQSAADLLSRAGILQSEPEHREAGT